MKELGSGEERVISTRLDYPAEIVPLPSESSEFFLDRAKWALGGDPMAVFDEEVAYRNVPPLPAGEEMLQEKVTARAEQSVSFAYRVWW